MSPLELPPSNKIQDMRVGDCEIVSMRYEKCKRILTRQSGEVGGLCPKKLIGIKLNLVAVQTDLVVYATVPTPVMRVRDMRYIRYVSI